MHPVYAGGVRVLIADDSAVSRAAILRRVRAAGREVVERATAADAANVDPGDLACALLDVDLGDGSGTDVAEKLRERNPGLPIAFFSSTLDESAIDRTRSYGQLFVKPDDLDLAVAWVLEHA